MNTKEIIQKLHEVGAIQFGSFTLKSGITSPIYIDMRLIISHPNLLSALSEELYNKTKDVSYDLLCGVPYTALPLATAISIKHNIPMIMRRKEVKKHGTKRIIEGKYTEGQTCLLIDDLITSGLSVMETVEPIKEEGLHIKDVALIIDREQGGRARLEEKGYRVHTLFTITELLDTLLAETRIDESTYAQVKEFIQDNQLQIV